MCCCCCCCCYISKSFCHSCYIQYGRFIDIVLISLLFSQFSSLHALWLTKSDKLFKTLYCTQNFLPIKIWKLTAPIYQVTCPKPPSQLFLFALFLTLVNNAFRSSFRYLLIIPKQTEISSTYTNSIITFAFKQRVQEGFRSHLYLVSFFQLYC